MNYREKFLYDTFKLSYLDREGFERCMKEIYVQSHFSNFDELSKDDVCKLVDNLFLSKEEMDLEIKRFYKHVKLVTRIMRKTYYVLSDRRQVLAWGEFIYSLYHYLKYKLILFIDPVNEYVFAKSTVVLVKGTDEAARYLETDPDIFASQAVEAFLESN